MAGEAIPFLRSTFVGRNIVGDGLVSNETVHHRKVATEALYASKEHFVFLLLEMIWWLRG